MKVLNVAEKNDSAKHIADIMARGRFNRRDGLSVYNKIYEFQYQVQGVDANMVMTSVSGHLLGLDFSQTYRKWTSCHPTQLFELPVYKDCKEANMINIKKTLEKEVRGAKMLIIWTDGDREGENIGMEIVDVCKAVNQRIRVLRARFSEITRPSIERAMQNLVQMAYSVSDAVDCRSELDLRIGAAFTRFQTLRLQKLFPGSLANKLVSYGSCQFPTMGFVVERYKEIENFLPENFWKLKVIHQVDDIRCEFSWFRNRLFDEEIVQMYLEICQEYPIARVEKCQSNPKSKFRPLPLETVELQKLANRKLKMSAKSIMATAEKLYTQGLISYPRTETNIYPKELNLQPLVEAQVHDQRWGGFAQRICDEYGGPNPRRGKKNDEAHPPIHPTKYSANLQGDEGRLYEFIVRHFLACVSQDAIGKETTVHIDVNGEKFVAHGLTVVAKNYLEVYTYERWSDKEIPNYEHIREFEPTAIEMVSGSTEPPKLLTEADLIALMDKNGIGTDATQAEHIETIKNREYVFVEQRDKLVPGKLGMALVDGYDSMGIAMSKPNLRAGLENDLKLICEGVKTKEEVLQNQIEKYRQIFLLSIENVNNLDAATQHFLDEAPAQDILDPNGEVAGLDIPEPVVQCTHCNAMIVLKRRQNNSWMVSCQGYPACRQTIWLPSLVLDAKVNDARCPTCTGNPATLALKVKPRSLHPFFPNEFTTCFGGCDPDILQMLDAERLNSGRIVPPVNDNQRNNRGRGAATGDRGGRGGRGGRGWGPDNGGGRGPPRGGGGGPPRGGGGIGIGGDGYGQAPSQGGGGSGPMRGVGRGRARGSQPRGGRSQDSGYQSISSWPPPSQQPSQQPAGNQLTCDCGNPAIILTVRKEGPNQGRDFGKCESQQCNYFQFTDEPPRGGPQGGQQAPAPSRFNTGNDFGEDGGDDIINCDCGQPSARRTCRKEGPNVGRDFFCCSKPQGEQCRFFSWADGEGAAGNSNQNFPRQGGSMNLSQNDSDIPMCQCYPPQPAAVRTVQKDGPNKGREFYCCEKPRDSQCNLFSWADEPQGGAGGSGQGGGRGGGGGGFSGGRGGARGRGQRGGRGAGRGSVDSMLFTGAIKTKQTGAYADGQGAAKKPRTCGLCRQPGHTRNKCPMNG